jgi:hypothetical protein
MMTEHLNISLCINTEYRLISHSILLARRAPALFSISVGVGDDYSNMMANHKPQLVLGVIRLTKNPQKCVHAGSHLSKGCRSLQGSWPEVTFCGDGRAASRTKSPRGVWRRTELETDGVEGDKHRVRGNDYSRLTGNKPRKESDGEETDIV